MSTKKITATVEDRQNVQRIADRAVDLYKRAGVLSDQAERFARSGIVVELLTVHEEIVPLRLAEMARGSDFDLMHDVGGIHKHLLSSKEQPRLMMGFLPRYAVHERV